MCCFRFFRKEEDKVARQMATPLHVRGVKLFSASAMPFEIHLLHQT